MTPRHGGNEGRVDAGHVAPLDGGDELLDSGDLVVLKVAQQRALEPSPTVSSGTGRALFTHPKTW